MSKHFGICRVSIAAMRLKPDDRAEIVSQLLFGERVEVLIKKHTNWAKVRCLLDDYVGWIDKRQIFYVNKEELDKYSQDVSIVGEFVHEIASDKERHCIHYGAELPLYDGINTKLPFGKFLYNGKIIKPEKLEDKREFLVRLAMKYISVPYLWGGRSTFGIDCSGLTQVLYKMIGINLPRDASEQINFGKTLDFVENAKPGDLAFFEKENGFIHHVGVCLDDGKILHASGMVKIDKLDHFGIYVKKEKRYTHKLRLCKNLLED